MLCVLATAGGALAAPQSRAESGLLGAVNATRVAHGLRPLRLDPTLVHAARGHSLEMLRGGYFAHGDVRRRLLASLVRNPLVGENLAWGSGSSASAATVIAEWLASPGHRANLLRPSFTRIGIGATKGRFLGYGGATVFTADFAGR